MDKEAAYIIAGQEAATEAINAHKAWPRSCSSAHEGYAVLSEEVDELWDHVKTKQSKRDLQAMRKEAIQVAAMALRFAVDVVDEGRGRE
jgi:ribosomal protein S15P/S13E